MTEQRGLWSETFHTFLRNTPAVSVYIGAMMLIAFAQEYMSSNGGLTFAQALAATFLAIPAHLSVLKDLSGKQAMNNEVVSKKLMTFTLHAFCLGVFSFLPAIAFAVICFVAGIETTLALSAAAFILLIAAAFVFARWGTVLPAIVMDESKTLAAASARSKSSFRYAFPRLLISFGLLTVAVFIPVFGLAFLFEIGDKFLLASGGVDAPLIVAVLLALIIGAYQVIMTAVILSRSFLRDRINQAAAIPVGL